MGVTKIEDKLAVCRILIGKLRNAEKDLLDGRIGVWETELHLIKEILDVRFDSGFHKTNRNQYSDPQ